MDPLPALLHEAGKQIAFPGRLRVFGDASAVAGMVGGADGNPDLCQASGGFVLAAAVGAAWAEERRGGRVVAVLDAAALADGVVGEALALAAHVKLANLVLVADGGEAQVRRLAGHGWRAGGPELIDGVRRPRAQPAPGDEPAGPLAIVLPTVASQHVWKLPRIPLRREWPPIHLPGLRAWRQGHRRSGDGAPHALAAGWLADLAARDQRLFLPHAEPRWAGAPATRAKLIAAAHLASEGQRVAWWASSGTALLPWLGALTEIGRRGLALKLLCAADDLPAHGLWPSLPEWWVMAPSDAGEASAVLAQCFDNEDASIVALPRAAAGVPPWPDDADYEPGAGRWLAAGGAATLVCDCRTAATALAARDLLRLVGIAAGVYACTSLAPLPLHDCATAPRPLLAIDAAASPGGLGGALRSALADREVAVATVGAVADQLPTAAEVAQAVRSLVGKN